MTVGYTIGIYKRHVMGHGDTIKAVTIEGTGVYMSAPFPPVFSKKEDAEKWRDDNCSWGVIVEVELRD
jgi:hypothetical protein